MRSGFVVHTRADALSNPRGRTARVRAAYGAVRAPIPKSTTLGRSRNNGLLLYTFQENL